MAQLNDTLISGDLRVTGTMYGNSTSSNLLLSKNTANHSYYICAPLRADDGVRSLTPMLYASEGSVTGVTADTWVKVELGNLNTGVYGNITLSIGCPASNSPFQIRLVANAFRYGPKSVAVVERTGYDTNNINRIVAYYDTSTGYLSLYLHVVATSGTLYWGSDVNLSSANNFTVGLTSIPSSNTVEVSVPYTGGFSVSANSYIGTSLITHGTGGNSTTPVYVNSSGVVQACTPSSMSVGNAAKATITGTSKGTYYYPTGVTGTGSQSLYENANILMYSVSSTNSNESYVRVKNGDNYYIDLDANEYNQMVGLWGKAGSNGASWICYRNSNGNTFNGNALTSTTSGNVTMEEIGGSAVDLNNYTASDGKAHWYFWGTGNASNVSNKPADKACSLNVLPVGAGSAGSYAVQIAYVRGTTDAYIRRRSDSSPTWTAWTKFLLGTDTIVSKGTTSPEYNNNSGTAGWMRFACFSFSATNAGWAGGMFAMTWRHPNDSYSGQGILCINCAANGSSAITGKLYILNSRSTTCIPSSESTKVCIRNLGNNNYELWGKVLAWGSMFANPIGGGFSSVTYPDYAAPTGTAPSDLTEIPYQYSGRDTMHVGLEPYMHRLIVNNTSTNPPGWVKIVTATTTGGEYASCRVIGKYCSGNGNWDATTASMMDFQAYMNVTSDDAKVQVAPVDLGGNAESDLIRIVRTAANTFELQVRFYSNHCAYSVFYSVEYERCSVSWYEYVAAGSTGSGSNLIAPTYDYRSGKVLGTGGSSTTPVYVDSMGHVKECTTSSMSVGSANTLVTGRSINGTTFNGSQNITTSSWGTSRTIYITDSDGSYIGSGVSVNGSANVSLKLPATIKATLKGNADTASNSTKWNGYALSKGTFSTDPNTISIV